MHVFRRDSTTCLPRDLQPSEEASVGGISFWKFIMILGSVVGFCAVLNSLYLVLRHAWNCYSLTEQKLVMRIQLVIPAFVGFYLAGMASYNAMPYLSNLPEIVESIAFAALFRLLIEKATGSADTNEQDIYFCNLDRLKLTSIYEFLLNKTPRKLKHNLGSLRWYRGICICVYQFPAVKIVWTPIFTGIFMGVINKTCLGSKAERAIHVVNGLIGYFSTTAAVLAFVRFYVRLRPVLKPYHAVRKAVILKQLVELILLQSVVMTILQVSKAEVRLPQGLSVGDCFVGIPAFMTQCEMLLFTFLFSWCFNVEEYKNHVYPVVEDRMVELPDGAQSQERTTEGQQKNHRLRRASCIHALGAMLNISDLLCDIARCGVYLARLSGPKEYIPRNLANQPAPPTYRSRTPS